MNNIRRLIFIAFVLTPVASHAQDNFVGYLKLGMSMQETVSRMQEVSGAAPEILAADEGTKLYLVSKQFGDTKTTLSATVKDGAACAITLK